MKTNTELLAEMLTLQNTMNVKVHAEWYNQGFNWYRAIWLESAEAVEQLPWKWWKHTVANTEQVQMELVDIWHFILSLSIQHGFSNEVVEYFKLSTTGEWDEKKLIGSLERLAHSAIAGQHAEIVCDFAAAMRNANLTLNQLYSMYIGKNILNMFRQDNGYKDGTYRKVWNGLEDNKHLVEVMNTLSPLTSVNYANDIYTGLTAAYAEGV